MLYINFTEANRGCGVFWQHPKLVENLEYLEIQEKELEQSINSNKTMKSTITTFAVATIPAEIDMA